MSVCYSSTPKKKWMNNVEKARVRLFKEAILFCKTINLKFDCLSRKHYGGLHNLGLKTYRFVSTILTQNVNFILHDDSLKTSTSIICLTTLEYSSCLSAQFIL